MSDTIIVHTDEPPTVEIDSTVPAAYIRFNDREVASTQPVEAENMIITVDVDESGRAIGVELVGVEKFNLKLTEKEWVIVIPTEVTRTRSVPALQPA